MATRFWVGGTGTWDSTTTTHWSATTGGAGGASAPVTGDSATFDGSSGTGTVTVDTTINGLSLNSITCGAFVGTLDFSVNNPSITLTGGGFSSNGSAVRAVKLGTGTWTISASNGTVWDFFGSNLTLTAGSSIVSFTAATPVSISIQLGTGNVFGTMNFSAVTNGAGTFINTNSGATIGTLNITGPRNFTIQQTGTLTITNPFNWVGSQSNPIKIESTNSGAAATISVASGSPTMSGAALNLMTFTGGATFTATNSQDLKGNTGITITAPSAGTGSHMIGG